MDGLNTAKKYILLVMCAFVLQAKAQIKHAIYIQAEDKKPFNVALANGQVKSSTESGYIILSQIADSLYPVTIISPSNDFPEQKFVVDMNNNDWEFSFEKNENNEYDMFDMIHSTVLNTYKEPAAQPVEVAAAQDSAQQNIDEKVEADTTTAAQPNNAPDTAVTQQPQQVIADKKPIKTAVPANKPQPNISKTGYYKVRKIFERASAKGIDLIYVDERKPKFDTIAIFIPAAAQDGSKNERLKKVAEPAKPKPATAKPTPEHTTAAPAVANNDDFLSLRKQMASANNEDEMLAIAKSGFANRLFSVAQIKNLSVLFLNEKNKLSFFQMAKPATVDSKDFYKLINQLTQPDLIEKFAALIQQ